MTQTRHAAVLLAAGGSRRLGTAKQLLLVDGEPLVRRAGSALLATQPTGLYVVVGSQADRVFGAVADVGAVRVDCDDWQLGLSASLRAGIAALPGDVEGALVALCDQPAMDARHLQALLRAFHAHPTHGVASGYAGVLGVPAVLPRSWFADVMQLSGDAGARELFRSQTRAVQVVDAPLLEFDVDEPSDRSRL
jgi:molybdenum cofactor cytidylyltransferase